MSAGLTAREFRLLTALVESDGPVRPRAGLLNAARDSACDGTDLTVDTFARPVRVKAESDPENPRHIVTMRGAVERLSR